MEECIPVWIVGVAMAPLITAIGVLWRRIGDYDERTEKRLDVLLRRTYEAEAEVKHNLER